jgi:predicted porin
MGKPQKKTLKLKKGRLQMKKTLIASAIAAATLTSNAFAMDPASDLAMMLDSMPTIYGNVQLVNVSTDTSTTGAPDESDSEFVDNGSTIGFKHSHEISDGLTGYVVAEMEFTADEKSKTGGLNRLDEAYIGLKGDFGDVRIGSDESVYQWIDIVDTFEAVGISGGGGDNAQGDAVNYVSPELADGLKIGITAPLDTKGTDAFSGTLAGMFEMDNMAFGLAYSLGRDTVDDAIGLSGSIGLDDLTLKAQYETATDDYMALMASYAMGANGFTLGYAMTSFDLSTKEDQSELYLQAMHNLSDQIYVYLEYKMTTDSAGVKGTDLDQLAVGAAYAF